MYIKQNTPLIISTKLLNKIVVLLFINSNTNIHIIRVFQCMEQKESFQHLFRMECSKCFGQIEIGCNKRFNACDPFPPVRLEFNTNPSSDRWKLLLPLCVPDINGQDCQPNSFHGASVYSNDAHPSWTRITIQLPEKVYSR